MSSPKLNTEYAKNEKQRRPEKEEEEKKPAKLSGYKLSKLINTFKLYNRKPTNHQSSSTTLSYLIAQCSVCNERACWRWSCLCVFSVYQFAKIVIAISVFQCTMFCCFLFTVRIMCTVLNFGLICIWFWRLFQIKCNKHFDHIIHIIII